MADLYQPHTHTIGPGDGEELITVHDLGGLTEPEIRQIVHGEPGTPGQDGATGPMGTDGPQGIPGSTGSAGATGSQGPAGDPGPPGARGSAGAKGSTGATGPKGATGASGAGSFGEGYLKITSHVSQFSRENLAPLGTPGAKFSPVSINAPWNPAWKTGKVLFTAHLHLVDADAPQAWFDAKVYIGGSAAATQAKVGPIATGAECDFSMTHDAVVSKAELCRVELLHVHAGAKSFRGGYVSWTLFQQRLT